MQTNKAIYLGSFDPLTNGHCDVILRSGKIFEQLIIAVGDNENKNFLFSQTERLKMLKDYVKDLSGVEVKEFSGLAVDFAKRMKAYTFIRGLRTEADYTYEMQMAVMNQSLLKELDTIFIPTRQHCSHISSTLVKEVARLGGDVSAVVPKHVSVLLREKFK